MRREGEVVDCMEEDFDDLCAFADASGERVLGRWLDRVEEEAIAEVDRLCVEPTVVHDEEDSVRA